MTVVVLTRHGESEWNSRQMITGWSDPPLSGKGEIQARNAGAALAARGVPVDRVYTSMLSRAGQTVSIMLDLWRAGPAPPVDADWRLNERHFGLLEGLTKAEVVARWGNHRRKRWRDDECCPPPALHPQDPAHPCHDPRYKDIPAGRLPGAERECDTTTRVLQFWHERVLPDIEAGRNVLVVSHLGPLRILARHLHPPVRGEPAAADCPNAELMVHQVTTHPCHAWTEG